jgi:hypothetical protein
LFLAPAAAAYSLAAGLFYRGLEGPLFDLEALKTTAVLSLACALAQDIVPRSFKEAVVFWRIRERVPGHRAFRTIKTDRYDLSQIINRKELAALPGGEQQLTFYKIYKKHQKDPTVAHCNFRYCAWRDTASLLLILSILTLPIACIISVSIGVPLQWKPPLLLAGSAFLAYLLTAVAARQVANALVGQVLSCETAGHPHSIAR